LILHSTELWCVSKGNAMLWIIPIIYITTISLIWYFRLHFNFFRVFHCMSFCLVICYNINTFHNACNYLVQIFFVSGTRFNRTMVFFLTIILVHQVRPDRKSGSAHITQY
jgi:hypothetical protein